MYESTDSTVTDITGTQLVSIDEVNTLKAELDRINSKFESLKLVNDQISARNTTKSNMIEAVKEYLLDNYDDLEMHADEIASLLDIELTREITYAVSMSVTVTVTLAPGDDADSIITDNLYVDSNNGNIAVDDYTVDYTNEA